MKRSCRLRGLGGPRFAVSLAAAATLLLTVGHAGAQELRLLRAAADPYGYPRPAPGATEVPPGTSLFFQVGFATATADDRVLPETVAVRVGPLGETAEDALLPPQRFTGGFTGKIVPGDKPRAAIAVYLERELPLQPSTTYVVTVSARSAKGAELAGRQGSWQFTTAPAAGTHRLQWTLDLSAEPARWHGGFFRGFCKPSFCTSAANRVPEYDLMDQLRQQSPQAWCLQRDFWLTGMEHQPAFLSGGLPNAVRERETRRIVGVEDEDEGSSLRLEDFFGHEQYGIASDRPLAEDYHPGDEVLVADGTNHARATVVRVIEDSPASRRLLVTRLEQPAGGWKTEYARPLPEREDPHAPGLFPPGGCYLRKWRPTGTPCYYWGRLDREWDLACLRYGRRLVVNFADAPGDLSVDGDNWTYPKDYAQHHAVVRAFTLHLIDRYGDACLDFIWSVFNEPDLAAAFWRSGDWNELQRFYDYTVDAILAAFEERGYDSRRVVVGGLEIGAIFGVQIEKPILKRFLAHCSPTAECEGALRENAAYADPRLEGKRSRRVEELCRRSGGQGSPCDFISIHSYNAAPVAAAKLIRGKQLALEIDPEYYAALWVNAFETCPGWAPPPDVAAADSYLGNGYFPTWCADVARRLLYQASQDPRFGYGESLVTFWPWPNSNFGGHNNASRVLSVDDDGDGAKDREVTVAMPILNFLGLLAGMGDGYWVLPEQAVGPHIVSGFASRRGDEVQLLVYAHQPADIESRSEDAFTISLDLAGIAGSRIRAREHRFDKDQNSYFRLGRQLRDRPVSSSQPVAAAEEAASLTAALLSGDRGAQLDALRRGVSFAELPEGVARAAFQLYEETRDTEVRAAIEAAGRAFLSRQQPCYSADEVAKVERLSELQTTRESVQPVSADGRLQLTLELAANGANFVVLKPGGDE